MKVVLFCGGQGMRLRDYSQRLPKPLTEIGPRPVIWHLMRYYAHFGHKDFVLCLGYGGAAIKDYFLNYDETASNDFVLHGDGRRDYFNRDIVDWKITFVDTGASSTIGERLLRAKPHLEGESAFLANYADGLSDLNLAGYVEDFLKGSQIAQFLSVRLPGSFHVVHMTTDGMVTRLQPISESALRINAGFFALRGEVFRYMNPGEELVVEAFERLIEAGKLAAVAYDGFWKAMDTFKDKIEFDELYAKGQPPWHVW